MKTLKRKIRVLRIMHRINIGGPTHHAAYLTKFLNNSKFETLLISGRINDDEESGQYILDKYKIKPIYLRNMFREINFFKDFKAYLEIRRIIKNFKPDIIHTHAAKSGALGRLAAIHEKTPYIVHTFHGHVFHSYFGYLKSKFYILIERFLAKKSNRIIAISRRQKQELFEEYKICKSGKIDVINLGFDLNKFSEKTNYKRKVFRDEFFLNDNDIAIGIIGRLTPIKNQKLFIDLIDEIYKTYNLKIKAFIIGDGEDFNLLTNYAIKKNIPIRLPNAKSYENERLIFTSWRKDMDFVYNGLDIVCLTSLNEGTPVTLIEAQSAGKPVISTDVGGVIDVVVNGKSGYIVSINKFDDLLNKTVELIIDDKKRISFSEYGKKYVDEKFSYKRLVSDIEKLYIKLIN